VVLSETNVDFTPLAPNMRFRQLPIMVQLKVLVLLPTEYVAAILGL
jgi:hypothetical protein